MNWTNPPATENQPGYANRRGQETHLQSSLPAADKPPELRIGKTFIPAPPGSPMADVEVFTLSLGGETIELVPLKNWIQLDHFRWTARGKLPAEPAGLEVAVDHVRIAGETVSIHDSTGCAKLERHFNDWLLLERETLELSRKKARAQSQSAAPEAPAQPESQPLRFSVEVDKRGQVHVHCVQGRLTVASIGLTPAGFRSLSQQGLMRKPHTIETGALHDWVELDGELCSFEKGRNDAVHLERILNERYLPLANVEHAKEVLVFLNAAAATGFDIQFPFKVTGVVSNHRYHLNEQSLELLQDPDHCGLLHKEIIVKLFPPNLVFKQKTPDGGEQYLPWNPENALNLVDEAGRQTTIYLSQPLNLLRLGPADLTAVFNHPAINRHMKATPQVQPVSEPQARPAAPSPVPQTQPQPGPSAPPRAQPDSLRQTRQPEPAPTHPGPLSPPPEPPPKPGEFERGLTPPASAPSAESPPPGNSPGLDEKKPGLKREECYKPLPNLWLNEILAQPELQHDWFATLTYSKMAERFGNSSEGKFGPCECWFISLGETEDIDDPAFKGIFITEKGSLGFLNQDQMARFYNRIAFIGPREHALQGVNIDLIAIALDTSQRLVFILSDTFRTQFDVSEPTLTEVLSRLHDSGAVIMGATEALASREPLQVVWTVPADQPDPSSPAALESPKPE